MKPNLNRKYFIYQPNCARCHDNFATLEEIRERVQQLKQNPQIPLGHTDCWKQGYLDAINDFVGGNQH